MISVKLTDGNVRKFKKNITGAEIAAEIGPGLAKTAIAIRINGSLKDLNTELNTNADISIALTAKVKFGTDPASKKC